MQLNVETLLSNPRGGGSKKLATLAKGTLGDFFKFCPASVPVLNLTIVSAERGGNVHRPVRIIPSRADGHRPSTLPVAVYTEGTQAVHGFVSSDGVSIDVLRELIENGPYHSKPKICAKAEQSTFELAPTSAVAEPEGMSVPEMAKVSETVPDDPVVAAVKPLAPEPVRLTPLQKLQRNEVSTDEINRLKETLADIVQGEKDRQRLTELPNTIEVTVSNITRSIYDHMRLQRNQSGTYQGVIANFYATRIALFAVKWQDDPQSDEVYTPWLFDVTLVIDFIGGTDKLAALARVRRQEVKQREAEEATSQPAPQPEAVEQAAQEDQLPDHELILVAQRFLAGQEEAKKALELARQEFELQQQNLARLLEQVKIAQAELVRSKDLVSQAEANLKTLALSDSAKKRIIAARDRLVALAAELQLWSCSVTPNPGRKLPGFFYLFLFASQSAQRQPSFLIKSLKYIFP